jgi:hypothetical protein
MKKIFYSIMMAATMLLASCGGKTTATTDTVATDSICDSVATAVVPCAATEVLPAAAPGPDAGGKVATEVVADSVAE